MLVGNNKNQEYLEILARGDNLSHAYIFFGPKNIGKTSIAKEFGRKIICENHDGNCDCKQCKLSKAGNHPDLMVYDNEGVLGVDEAREMISFLDLKPYQAKYKFLLISHGERMTIQAANSLLKTLEEPPGNTVIVITTENIKNLLETIVSRSQIIKFHPVEVEETKSAISQAVDDKELVEKIVSITGGQVGLAFQLGQDRDQLSKIIEVVNEFEQIIYSKDIAAKINFSQKLSKEKENLNLYFDCLEGYYSRKLKEEKESSLMIVKILDKLSEVRELLQRNVNTQLAIESLMLIGG